MAATFIYKPETYKGPVILIPDNQPRTAPTITAPDGKTFTGKYLNTNEGHHQYVFPTDLYNYQDLQVTYGSQKGTLASGAIAYEGTSLGNLTTRPGNKGSLGSGSSYGGFGAFSPGMAGQYGAVPANIMGMFPSPSMANFKNIKNTKIDKVSTNPVGYTPNDYKFVDPFSFAEKYGAFQKGEFQKNFDASKDMALQTLNTELKGLQAFAPAASALKRAETALDNQFNQQQRTQQINSTLPGFTSDVNADLSGQRGRANSYAEGRIPDPVQDRAFELGIRSDAADRASAGGFGAASSVARKASDLMSAAERVKLSQYGDQLLSSNVGERLNFANWQLAPTEYSNAGSQINVNPNTNISQVLGSSLGMLNAATLLPTSQAFGAQVQQSQFDTANQVQQNQYQTTNAIQQQQWEAASQIGQNQFQGTLNQDTKKFNASGMYNASTFNATNANNFAMSKFGYQAGYANSVAGAAQTDINTQFGVGQQDLYGDVMSKYMNKSQDSGLINSLFSLAGITGIATRGFGLGGKGGKGGGGSGGTGSGLPGADVGYDLSKVMDFGADSVGKGLDKLKSIF